MLTVYGIETVELQEQFGYKHHVATVLTVYGIETCYLYHGVLKLFGCCNNAYRLRY